MTQTIPKDVVLKLPIVRQKRRISSFVRALLAIVILIMIVEAVMIFTLQRDIQRIEGILRQVIPAERPGEPRRLP